MKKQLATTTIALLVALALPTTEADAERRQIRFLERGAGGASGTPDVSNVVPEPVRVAGSLTHSRRGLAIDGELIHLNGKTSIFPGTSDRTRSASSMSGRVATVYGKRTPRGIEASLIILDGSASDDWKPTFHELLDRAPDPEQFMIPSDVDSDVGELTEDVPG